MFPDPEAPLRGARASRRSRHPPAAAVHRRRRGGPPAVAGRRRRASSAASRRSSAASKSYIADGHHRHATALRYRDAVGPDGAWTLGYFTPIEAPGPARAAVPPDPVRGPVARGGASAARRAAFRVTRRPDAPPRRRAVPPPRRRPTPSRWPSPGGARSWPRPSPAPRPAARPRPPAEPARARHVLPAPRGARPAPRRPRRGGELRPLAGRGRGGAGRAGLPPRRADARRRRCGRSWTWPRRGSRCRPRARSSTRSSPRAS